MPATMSKGAPPRKPVDHKAEAQVKELRTPGALTELSGEIRKRKSQLHK